VVGARRVAVGVAEVEQRFCHRAGMSFTGLGPQF
jgi:hypothetical protein